jgi:hypothetical protein
MTSGLSRTLFSSRLARSASKSPEHSSDQCRESIPDRATTFGGHPVALTAEDGSAGRIPTHPPGEAPHTQPFDYSVKRFFRAHPTSIARSICRDALMRIVSYEQNKECVRTLYK